MCRPGVAEAVAAVGGEEEAGREMGPGHTMPPEAAMAWDAWFTAALDDPSIGTHIRE
jgi:hypothetical protein